MTLHSVGERLGEAGAQAAWAQWSALGAGTLQGARRATSIIDPEALLLLSLCLIPKERRLRDLTRWWAEVGSELLSVQRTKTLAKDFPSSVEGRLRAYSRWATRAGDKRWKKYASEETTGASERDRKGPEEPPASRSRLAPSAAPSRVWGKRKGRRSGLPPRHQRPGGDDKQSHRGHRLFSFHRQWRTRRLVSGRFYREEQRATGRVLCSHPPVEGSALGN
ncbi:hypothetical protein GGP96_002067 [Salinibacter ruber]|nr:hypothetical protein [Salinibacter ruber]